MKRLCEPGPDGAKNTDTKAPADGETPLRTLLRETADGYVIELEIPAEALPDADVSIENGRLVIRYPKT